MKKKAAKKAKAAPVDPRIAAFLKKNPAARAFLKKLGWSPRSRTDWMGMLAALLAAWAQSQANKPPVVAPPVTPPPPVPPVKPPVVPPVPPKPPGGTVTTDDSAHGRPAQSLSIRFKGLKRDGKHIQGQPWRDFLSQADPAGPGDVVNFDAKALDQDGKEIGPFGDETGTALDQFLKDPALGTYMNVGDELTNTGEHWDETNHRIDTRLNLTGEAKCHVAGEYRNYGLGPNVRVTDDTGEGTCSIQLYAKLADGRELESNVLTFRTKWWGR